MGKLLIATTNPAKISEYRELIGDRAEILTPKDLGITEQPVEDGEMFAENSLLKANFYWQRAKMPTLADDGGLEVDALGGQPGVHSHRIDGVERSDEDLISAVLERVRKVPSNKRTARIHVVLTLRIDAIRNFQAEAALEGLVRASNIKSEPGFPYRQILWIPKRKKFFAELSRQERQAISSRREAFEKLLPYIQQYV
ncbi:MAG: non-canonical purine NTP pyrophosphatase [Candidatus Kerfeldbacteria bacterium]|nr:non-canonical purine NTP pyrophosphatase [Candidatus Kerfeldbacteria bacterium]